MVINLFSWLLPGTKEKELRDTRASWEETEREWKASPLASIDPADLADEIVREAMQGAERVPAAPIIAALCEGTEELIRAESVGEIEPFWSVIENNVEAAVEFREMVARRSSWATNFKTMRGVWAKLLSGPYREFVKALPESCFGEWDEKGEFEVPLIDLLDNPAEIIERFISFPFTDDTLNLKLFEEYRRRLRSRIAEVSGMSLADLAQQKRPIVPPTAQKNKSARELLDLYLGGTPFADLFSLPVPFSVPEHVRFEHCHVIGGTGHGKTQLLQKMIYADLVQSQYNRRSVVVIDSQGDMIQKLSRLELFSPYVPGGLGDRLVLIDPSDVLHPFALNLFDAHMDRVKDYDAADKERVLNGVVELYETFFDALLGAELTARQDVVFRYIARLMLTIPDATIHTLMQIMENGKAFKPHMERLEGSGRRFFETEFFSPSFAPTKSQILKRLWGVLSTPAFDRMFSQQENKLDLFEAMNGGKIILVNTAKDVLKEEGSRVFGRFFIAMLAQAAMERSTIRDKDRTPTFVYADEAHEYFDDRIEAILNQARKFKVGITLAHQTLDQLSTRLRSVILADTSIKCAGGVSAKDARSIADELHTTPEFIDGMRRKGPKTEFAVWVKNVTPHAVRLSVPLGFLERQYTLDEEGYDLLIGKNRERYSGTVVSEPIAAEPVPEETPPQPMPATRAKPVLKADGAPLPRPPREISAPRDPGKGGPKHTYLQSLVKELAGQQGLKATIEAPVPGGGQVDVLIERDGVLAAIEISVTTPVEYEQQNLHKCLRAGYPKVAVVLAKSKTQQSAYRAALFESVLETDRERVSYLTPEEIPDYIVALAPPPPRSERIVRGYRVKGAVSPASAEDGKVRRDAVARLIARSLADRDG
ncbi:MAG: type IV secretion system DNA-binding domain-containing protein [Rhizomicrobium sp.]|nr:type IV secretion system DNA-binding domain-containing protein [Rhizomicrobium sp.]